MKSFFKYLSFCLILISQLYSGSVLSIFETPTAVSFEKGEYEINLTAYKEGGIGIRTGLGLGEFLMLGILEDIDGIIGNSKNKWNIPGVYGKIKFTPGTSTGFNIAIGYDSFFNGSFVPRSRRVSGVYLVMTRGFGHNDENPHMFSFGARYPLIPYVAPLEGFTSFMVSISRFGMYGTELESITFRKNRKYDFINNHLVGFKLNEHLAFQFIFQIASHWEEQNGNNRLHSEFGRNIRIIYGSSF